MYPDPIIWRLHLHSGVSKVYDALDSDGGRASFWAERAIEKDGSIHFEFINGEKYISKIIRRERPHRFELDYFESRVVFELQSNEKGGTDVTMTNEGVSEQDYQTVYAGWLSVLFALKAYVDFGIDIRNHDATRTWDQGFIEN